MDAGLFLAQFGHLADSPGGVGKLRNLILELAVRGQLVPQNPDDEPASDLLRRIEAEKARLVKAGEMKPSKLLPPIREDEAPYEVPDGWVWVRLGEVCKKMGAGSTPLGGMKVYVDDGVPFLRSQNVWNDGLRLQDVVRITHEIHENMSGTHVKNGDVLLNITGASIGRCAVVPSDLSEANVSQHVAILRLIDTRTADYLHLCVISPIFQQTIMEVQVGVSREGLSMTRLKLFPFAIPPLAEQERIVVKVDELMALCDQLEAEQAERDHLRERATKSTLHHLTDAPTRAEARRYWHYAEQHFPHLFDRSATVADLRATILQLAVQGRLVPQHPDDEPASELLRRIEAEKKRLIKAGEIKPSKPLPPVGEGEAPYEVPDGWTWSSLEQLAWDSSYGTSEKCNYTGTGFPVLRIPNISGKNLNLEDMKYTLKPVDWDGKSALESGDFLIIRTNGSSDLVGRGKLIRHKFSKPHYYASYLIRFRLVDFGSIPEWIDLIWNSNHVRRLIAHIAQTTAGQFNVNMTNLSKIAVPIPPKKESQHIVAKVDELMALCDQLEAAADERQALSGRLFDSIVYHLFESAPLYQGDSPYV